LIYVLGLCVLWVPLARTYTHDFVAAWHAVNLVPKGVIAGLGIKQLVALPLLIIILVTSITLALDRMFSLLSKIAHNRGRVNIWRADTAVEGSIGSPATHSVLTYTTTWVTVGSLIWLYLGLFIFTTFSRAYMLGIVMVLFATIGLWFVFSVVYLSSFSRAEGDHSLHTTMHGEGRYSTAIRTEFSSWRGCILYIGSFVLVLGLVYVVWRFFSEEIRLSLQNFTSVDAGSTADAVVIVIVSIVTSVGSTRLVQLLLHLREGDQWEKWQLISKASLVLATSAFLTAFLLTAVNHKPPLPPVEIDKAVNTEGRLIGHTDGFWYVYSREDNQEWELIAIPDSEVETVRVHPNGQ
jgi:hypothetical protein